MSNQKIIKTGFCVSYDWELLKKAIPRIYEYSDVICLAIDKNRRSWSGNSYDFNNEAFYAFVKSIDSANKIDIYEDDFSLPELNARQNCNRHRTLMADRMGKGGWHVQIDSDEYFLDFGLFVSALKKINPNPTGAEKPLNVCPFLVPLIKKTETGYLFVDFRDRLPEHAPFATTKPQYERARQNGHFNWLVPTHVIHETWARGEQELWYKMNNWGHSAEELEENKRRLSYYNLWKSLDEYNYRYITNFHPALPEAWPYLGFCKGKTIEEFIDNFKTPEFPLSKIQLFMRNNRNVARFKFYTQKLVRRWSGN
ncbi:MAG: hypothetical protein ACOYXT_17760 [Bacteroidota bacterium]